MRIISKFKDYYDYMQYLGIDDRVVYTRETVRFSYGDVRQIPFIDKQRRHVLPKFDHQVKGRNYILQYSTVVFCGQCYTYWMYIPDRLVGDIEYIWNIDRLKEVYDSYIEEFYPNKRYLFNLDNPNSPLWKEVEATMIQPANPKLLEEYSVPVILNRGYNQYENGVILNPNLSNIEFYKAVSPEMAWQQLSMWISREPEVGETTRTEKNDLLRHGMDGMSFKRSDHPGKPRRK